MAVLLLILIYVSAFVVTIKTPLWVHGMIVLASIIYLKSSYVRSKEIGGIIDVLLVIGLWAVMLVGNLYVFLFFTPSPGTSLAQSFRWLITPNL